MITSTVGLAALGAFGWRSFADAAPAAPRESTTPRELNDPAAPARVETAERWSRDTAKKLPVDVGEGGIVVFHGMGGGHQGVDIASAGDRWGKSGQTLIACVDGVLCRQGLAAEQPRMGNAWVIAGIDGLFYRYHHMESFAEGLVVGSRVRRGQPIGTLGNTGNAAAAAHLHFEVRRDTDHGTPIDPLSVVPFDRYPRFVSITI